MKISELIKLYGVPVRVNHKDSPTEFFEIIGSSRHVKSRDMYPSYDSDGFLLMRLFEEDVWERYVELKPKKKLEAYIVKVKEIYSLRFSHVPGCYPHYGEILSGDAHRAPQFDCEI